MTICVLSVGGGDMVVWIQNLKEMTTTEKGAFITI
jgi:hypothetical protein